MAADVNTKGQARRVLKPIDVNLLGIGVILDFPIYTRGEHDRRFTLLQGPRRPFSKSVYRRIQEDFGGRAYIYPHHVPSFQKSAQATLTYVFADSAKSPEEKVQALMGRVETELARVFDQSDSGKVPDFSEVSVYARHVTKLLECEAGSRTQLILESLRQNNSLPVHCLQVCMYGMMLVSRYFPEFNENQREEIALGFLCHDIGKVQVSASIIEKLGKLNALEWQILHQVPDQGVGILKEWGIEKGLALDVVQSHREHYDGSGYPKRLKGRKIPLVARVCCIVDAFSSLTTRKPYRMALLPYDACWVMDVENRGHYDPSLLKLFVDMMTSDGTLEREVPSEDQEAAG
ncbi:MAG: HD-GYP domain-containing protein [Nitrospinota bacterium]